MPSNDVFANVRQEMEAMKEEQHRVKEERQKRIPELQAESHQIRAQADEIRAKANEFMTEAHAANAGLKAHVRQFRAEVNRMVGAFAQVSHNRAASWKQTLNAVRGRKSGRAHPGASGR